MHEGQALLLNGHSHRFSFMDLRRQDPSGFTLRMSDVLADVADIPGAPFPRNGHGPCSTYASRTYRQFEREPVGNPACRMAKREGPVPLAGTGPLVLLHRRHDAGADGALAFAQRETHAGLETDLAIELEADTHAITGRG